METTIVNAPTTKGTPVHGANVTVWHEVEAAAARRGLTLAHNSSGARQGRFDGYHSYALHDPSVGADRSIRSRACVAWRRARYVRRYLPSIIGEQRALRELLAWIAAA
jgi:hypothetical protein